MEVNGKKVIEIVYKGEYGKTRYGTMNLFATNMGKIATFDVVVSDDIKLYLRQPGT